MKVSSSLSLSLFLSLSLSPPRLLSLRAPPSSPLLSSPALPEAGLLNPSSHPLPPALPTPLNLTLPGQSPDTEDYLPVSPPSAPRLNTQWCRILLWASDITDWLIVYTDVGSGAQGLSGEVRERKLGLHADQRAGPQLLHPWHYPGPG